MSYELTDRQLFCLMWVRDGLTIPKMVERSGTSNKTIQNDLDFMEELGLFNKVKNQGGNTLVGGRELTEKGKQVLRHYGITTKPQTSDAAA